MWIVEHTDTCGGEANYTWYKTFGLSEKYNRTSRLALVRQAKALCGLSGVRCDVSLIGEVIKIQPKRICQVVFITWME